MSRTISSASSSSRALRLWLAVVAGLIFAMILVGGATRLTESGLSIVEWKPLTGTIPRDFARVRSNANSRSSIMAWEG